MKAILKHGAAAILIGAMALFPTGQLRSAFAEATNREKLEAHTQEFRREVIEVTDGVYVAVGFALANSIMIEGDDGVIIVDTTESQEAAAEIKAEFEKLARKPVKAIIYTHNHTDHIMGAKIFAGDDRPDVIAHETTDALVQKIYSQIRPIILQRSVRQFGVGLPDNLHFNCGIGPKLRVSQAMATDGYIKPNKTFSDSLEIEVAGVRMKLVHAVGETDDQIYVWLPDKKVLLPGDNFYRSFPNLYAIRGTAYRDVRQWADSLDLMLAEGAEHLIPSHTRPISGASEIRTRLTNYRDAIRHVHAETIAGLNRGMTPDQLVDHVHLPDHLAADPWLVEYYGTVEWSVRSIFAGTLGWFDGNATNLSPLSPADRARRLTGLVSERKLMKAAKKALEKGDYQWAAELADHLIALDADKKATREARTIKADALVGLADGQISANGRNYYLTQAQQIRPR